jgi:excisionase family DNA binding protein
LKTRLEPESKNEAICSYNMVTDNLQSKAQQGFKKTQGIANPVRQNITKRLYSIQEASIYLGRTVWAIREMLWAGKLPYIKDGRRILLDINDMNQWIEKSKTKYTF